MEGSPTLTVGSALTLASDRLGRSGSESARLDAELLLGHVLRVERTTLLAHPEAPVGSDHASAFDAFVGRRAAGEPVAFIRGFKEFYGIALHVDARVLIPRPETETLVDLALERIRGELTSRPRPADAPPYLTWDMGTGSGAVAIALATELRRRRYGDAVAVHLSDVSADALSVALENAVSHGVADVMVFATGDLTEVSPPPGRAVDLLVANLPYIPSPAMAGLPVAASFEPWTALDGGPDGLEIIRRLLLHLPPVLTPEGMALLEIGSDQAEAVGAAAAGALPGWRVTIQPDLGGAARVARVEHAE
ncbi:peptide chain release factor N(5)-glutamine methyltransferase [soil metagenome]